jgi:hypothetical protein
MAGYKTWAVGEEVLAADLNSYVQSQIVARFPNAGARTAQLPAPAVNQLSMRDDRPGYLERWNGSAWVDINANSELAYAELTAPVNPSGTTAPTANTVVGTSAITLDGGPISVEFRSPQVQTGPGVSTSLMLNLWDGATDLGFLGQLISPGSGVLTVPVHCARRLVPTAGSHAYSIRAWVPAGAGGTVGAGPGGINQLSPAYIRVTRAA